jgi:predicted negative regulator of RcsB-dependent stress response
MFIFRKIKVYLILAAVLGAAGFAAWKYYEYTQNQIKIYAENAARAETVAQANQAALEQTQADLIAVREQFNEVSRKFAAAESRVEALEEKLSEHELDFLAASKPGLVENIIDKASNNVLRCLEIASGSPLTEDEINATKRSEINSECPDLANPNYRP